jgi:cytochrome c oxidase subunit 2
MIESIIPQASSFAGDIDFLIGLIAVIVLLWFFAAQGLFFYFILKFRAKPGVRAVDMDGYNPEHKKWVTWPHNLVLVCDVIILIFAVRVWNHVKLDLPTNAQGETKAPTLRIIGQRWAWSFQYAGADGTLDTSDDLYTGEDLYVKQGEEIVFIGTSRDVLHSFSVPAFRLKQDVIPGRDGLGWFKAERAGTYDIQCTEICGIGHGVMFARIHVLEPAAYDAWAAAAPKGQAASTSASAAATPSAAPMLAPLPPTPAVTP